MTSCSPLEESFRGRDLWGDYGGVIEDLQLLTVHDLGVFAPNEKDAEEWGILVPWRAVQNLASANTANALRFVPLTVISKSSKFKMAANLGMTWGGDWTWRKGPWTCL